MKLPPPDQSSDSTVEGHTVQLKGIHEPINDGAALKSVKSRLRSLETQYEVLGHVGDGGMGVVDLAMDRKLGRYVAIKRLKQHALASASIRERFYREAKAIASLNHIHIVHVYSLSESPEGPYIVMEYVPGPTVAASEKGPPPPYTLADRVERDGAIALDESLDILAKLCKAMAYAHSCKVIHRDLKPSNVLIDPSGEPKIVDFGIARMAQPTSNKLTATGDQMLSIGYGAPEQETDSSDTDERADVYGLGALLYFCLTGKNPRYFREHDVPEVIRMPLVKALEHDRDNRWRSVKEFASALMLVKGPTKTGIATAQKFWRCKWCATTNPTAIKYCGKCGWDGGASCAECGSEMRFGIQYCGVCGADAREYEAAAELLKNMEENLDEKAHGVVAEQAKRIASFPAMGLSGRRLVERVHRLGANSEKAVTRRKKLSELIDRELREQNYEQVRRLIDEHNTLSADNAFAGVGISLTDLIFKRDIASAKDAIEKSQWAYAADKCRHLLADVSPGNLEASRLLKRATFRLALRRIARSSGAVLVAIIFYVVSAAPIYRALGRPARGGFYHFYRPSLQLYKSDVLRPILHSYSKAWVADEMYSSPELEWPPYWEIFYPHPD